MTTDDSHDDSLLRYQKAIVELMDSNGSFAYIRGKCAIFCKLQDRIYDFTIAVDCCELLDRNAELGNMVLNHPAKATKIFQEVVFVTIQSLSLLPQCESSAQITVRLKLNTLPNFPEYRVMSISDVIRCSKVKRLIQFEGIVVGMSVVHKYTKSARYVCPGESCRGSTGDLFTRIHIPGAKETQTVRKDFRCLYCDLLLVEDVSCRVLADKRIVELVDTSVFSTQTVNSCRQAVVVYLRDEMVNPVDIGQKLAVIGLPVFDTIQNVVYIECNNIVELHEQLDSNAFAPDDVTNLPPSILNIFRENVNSPWAFGLNLAFQFAAGIVPPGIYFNVKMSILLSLLADSEQPLDLLAVGSDVVTLQRLLEYGGSFAPRLVRHSLCNNLQAAVSRDRRPAQGLCYIEGGSLLLAHNGICLVLDSSLKQKIVKSELIQVLESGVIHVCPPSSAQQQQYSRQASVTAAGDTVLKPLSRRCCIWSLFDSVSHNVRHSAATGHFDYVINPTPLSKQSTNDLTSVLFSLFSLVCYTDTKIDSYTDELLTESVLSRAMETKQDNKAVAEQDFHTFIDIARRRNVTLGSDSKQLIQGYYVASRRLRASSRYHMPANSINTVTCMAKSCAKLNWRSSVATSDAVLAVYLYEQMLLTRTGFSPLSVQSVVHTCTAKQFAPYSDAALFEFHKQLSQLIAIHSADFSGIKTEE